MKLPSQLLPLVPLVASLMTAQAATLAVLPGTSIQAKINLAVAGDIVAIFGGTYNEDITINKAIRLVEVSGQQVTLNGNVTFSGVTACPPFEGFTVGSPGRGITVTNTPDFVFRNLDARNGSGITMNGTSSMEISDCQLSNVTANGTSSLKISDCQLSNVTVNEALLMEISNCQLAGGLTAGGSDLKISNSSLSGGINHTSGILAATKITVGGDFHSQTSAQKTVAFRVTVSGDTNLRSKRAWVGYSQARSINFTDANAGKLVVVGCLVDRQGGEANGIYCNVSNSQIQLVNNRIVRVGYGAYHYYGWQGHGDENGIDLRGGGNSALIANNYCQMQHLGGDGPIWGVGVYVRDFTQVSILNNVIVGARYGIAAPFGASAQNNLYGGSPWGGSLLEANGVIAEGTLYTDPLFVENEAPKLQAGSPCINAGTPDPRYNDRDGSRNDIGPSGGAWFDPDGWTTENPVVISFDLSPDLVLEGVDTEVILSEGQAVSAP